MKRIVMLGGAGANRRERGRQALDADHGRSIAATKRRKLRQVGAEVLFWNQAQRDQNFPRWKSCFPAMSSRRAGRSVRFPPASRSPIAERDVEACMTAAQHRRA